LMRGEERKNTAGKDRVGKEGGTRRSLTTLKPTCLYETRYQSKKWEGRDVLVER